MLVVRSCYIIMIILTVLHVGQQVQLSSPPGGTTPKSETLCGHWKVFEHTKTFEKLTYENAQAACRKNVGFFLPSEALWNNVLMEMKTGTGECRELAATFDKVPLWFTRHGKEERSYALYSSVCVGKWESKDACPFYNVNV